jgi:hypothetical protein
LAILVKESLTFKASQQERADRHETVRFTYIYVIYKTKVEPFVPDRSLAARSASAARRCLMHTGSIVIGNSRLIGTIQALVARARARAREKPP